MDLKNTPIQDIAMAMWRAAGGNETEFPDAREAGLSVAILLARDNGETTQLFTSSVGNRAHILHASKELAVKCMEGLGPIDALIALTAMRDTEETEGHGLAPGTLEDQIGNLNRLLIQKQDQSG